MDISCDITRDISLLGVCYITCYPLVFICSQETGVKKVRVKSGEVLIKNVLNEPNTNLLNEPNTNLLNEPNMNLLNGPNMNLLNGPNTNFLNEPTDLSVDCSVHDQMNILKMMTNIVPGTMHQGNKIFPDSSRGRFCLCAAVVAIESLQNLENPFADVDDVLIEGASLYKKVRNKLIEQHAYLPDAYLSFRDLPQDMETSSNQFMCDVNEGDLLLGKCISTDDETVPITQAVKQTFDRHNAGLIIIGNLAICIFLNANGQFCLFDSHSRTLQGEQSSNGTAILMCFASLEDLQEQIVRLVCSIASEPFSV